MKCCKKCKRVLILTKDGVTSYLCGETNDHVNGNSICNLSTKNEWGLAYLCIVK